MDLAGMAMRSRRQNQRVTVLFREGGTWHDSEIQKLVAGLHTSVSLNTDHRGYLLIPEEYTKEEILEILGDVAAYTLEVVMGLDNEALPWKPRFI